MGPWRRQAEAVAESRVGGIVVLFSDGVAE